MGFFGIEPDQVFHKFHIIHLDVFKITIVSWCVLLLHRPVEAFHMAVALRTAGVVMKVNERSVAAFCALYVSAEMALELAAVIGLDALDLERRHRS